MKISYGHPTTRQHILQMLDLQRQNLPANITKEEAQAQGFVTVQHHEDLLWEMNAAYPHTVAMDGERIVGYALVMTVEFKNQIPVLIPMFEQIEQLSYKGKPLADYRYFVMGQVCIAKSHRGQGIFGGMYRAMSEQLKGVFDCTITEVSLKNKRSMRAHEKVGFETLWNYQSPDGENWRMIILEF